MSADQARRRCNADSLAFETTADLPLSDDIFGQPRGVEAIAFGIGIAAPGYNLFVAGPIGSGRATAIERHLQRITQGNTAPADWVYVSNFADPLRPMPLRLRQGQARRLAALVDALIEQVLMRLQRAFEAPAYQQAAGEIAARVQQAQEALLTRLQAQARTLGFELAAAPSGLQIVPQTAQLPQPSRETQIESALQLAAREMRQVEQQARQALEQLDEQLARAVLTDLFQEVLNQVEALAEPEDQPALRAYLQAALDDLIAHLRWLKPGNDEALTAQRQALFNRYRVNVFVDNSALDRPPVLVEDDPTPASLTGRIEPSLPPTAEGMPALWSAHLSLRPGALHRANGGYLILRARHLLDAPESWQALKRSLLRRTVVIRDTGAPFLAQAGVVLPEPQPIPLNVKVILIGRLGEYWTMRYDEDFCDLFKAYAEFSDTMPRTPENEHAYALFLRRRHEDEGILPFDRSGVAAIIEHGSRLAEDQQKLSTRFAEVADLAREASFFAVRNGRKLVTAADVKTALTQRHQRFSHYEESTREQVLRGRHFIATSGSACGQVNGLSVYDLEEYAFGMPVRITARSYLTREGITDIDREIGLTDKTHDKGLAIIKSYLSGLYSVEQSLVLSANIVFEQSYASHEGDSASCAMIIALLSVVTGLPVPQSLAITGTLDQLGNVRRVGSVNTKIEGFFDICKARGLTRDQGVVIPTANVEDLMLREDVVQAVAEGRFHLFAVDHINDLIELMFKMPAGERGADGRFPEGSLHARVEAILREVNERLDGQRKQQGEESKPRQKRRLSSLLGWLRRRGQPSAGI
ncbi:MAG: AAA family ATPase [Thermoflexales bacterium]|nr:AAA family ATPase [Thermoflexales bacterium]